MAADALRRTRVAKIIAWARARTWWHLRSLGEIQALRVSYAALVFAPLIAKAHGIRNVLELGSFVLSLAFFGSLFLMLATLLYDVFCPSVVKRFPAPIDYFRELLQVSDLATRVGVDDAPPRTFNYARSEYDSLARRSPRARLLCLVSYAVSGACVAVLMMDRTYEIVVSLT